MPRVFLIDTDTASDDAIALAMAMRAADVRVAAISTVAGNVEVRQAANNALYVAELCGVSIPVYVGAAQPLRRPNAYAHWFHGSDGLGDHGYRPSKSSPEQKGAIDAIIETAFSNPGLTLVCLGPLTNIALALGRRPELTSQVSRCVIMGGALNGGNVTPAAEYNIWLDPDAAHIVLRSGLRIELVTLDLCLGDAIVNAHDIAQLNSLPGPFGSFAVTCSSRAREVQRERSGADGLSLADPLAMAIALDPSLVTRWSEHYVEVETESELTRGETVVDRRDIARSEHIRQAWAQAIGGSKTKIGRTIDVKKWKQALLRSLSP
ncbi:nucleoside hydrolase [Bradyrhizobium sp.]|jgi:purine nucleosidase|uniref:nucleoside hydrolase n=1 Tax=Bradyrhizobium sp. TaxID=376 RepID=UPI003C1ED753